MHAGGARLAQHHRQRVQHIVEHAVGVRLGAQRAKLRNHHDDALRRRRQPADVRRTMPAELPVALAIDGRQLLGDLGKSARVAHVDQFRFAVELAPVLEAPPVAHNHVMPHAQRAGRHRADQVGFSGALALAVHPDVWRLHQVPMHQIGAARLAHRQLRARAHVQPVGRRPQFHRLGLHIDGHRLKRHRLRWRRKARRLLVAELGSTHARHRTARAVPVHARIVARIHGLQLARPLHRQPHRHLHIPPGLRRHFDQPVLRVHNRRRPNRLVRVVVEHRPVAQLHPLDRERTVPLAQARQPPLAPHQPAGQPRPHRQRHQHDAEQRGQVPANKHSGLCKQIGAPEAQRQDQHGEKSEK